GFAVLMPEENHPQGRPRRPTGGQGRPDRVSALFLPESRPMSSAGRGATATLVYSAHTLPRDGGSYADLRVPLRRLQTTGAGLLPLVLRRQRCHLPTLPVG